MKWFFWTAIAGSTASEIILWGSTTILMGNTTLTFND
jgi:hypothetical protein